MIKSQEVSPARKPWTGMNSQTWRHSSRKFSITAWNSSMTRCRQRFKKATWDPPHRQLRQWGIYAETFPVQNSDRFHGLHQGFHDSRPKTLWRPGKHGSFEKAGMPTSRRRERQILASLTTPFGETIRNMNEKRRQISLIRTKYWNGTLQMRTDWLSVITAKSKWQVGSLCPYLRAYGSFLNQPPALSLRDVPQAAPPPLTSRVPRISRHCEDGFNCIHRGSDSSMHKSRAESLLQQRSEFKGRGRRDQTEETCSGVRPLKSAFTPCVSRTYLGELMQGSLYASVESCHIVADQGVEMIEWTMATTSDAKGSLPIWTQKLGVPGAITKDVGYYMKWISERRSLKK